jgi:hypothetical protein
MQWNHLDRRGGAIDGVTKSSHLGGEEGRRDSYSLARCEGFDI